MIRIISYCILNVIHGACRCRSTLVRTDSACNFWHTIAIEGQIIFVVVLIFQRMSFIAVDRAFGHTFVQSMAQRTGHRFLWNWRRWFHFAFISDCFVCIWIDAVVDATHILGDGRYIATLGDGRSYAHRVRNARITKFTWRRLFVAIRIDVLQLMAVGLGLIVQRNIDHGIFLQSSSRVHRRL